MVPVSTRKENLNMYLYLWRAIRKIRRLKTSKAIQLLGLRMMGLGRCGNRNLGQKLSSREPKPGPHVGLAGLRLLSIQFFYVLFSLCSGVRTLSHKLMIETSPHLTGLF